MQPLSAEYRRNSGAQERLKNSGWIPDRYQPRSRRHSRKLLFGHDNWKAEFYQGLEQMYGIALRDPTAYRPFVEFCLSLPTEMFMRDGETRWLAKQMAKGIMPDEQRNNPLTGWWDADWHIRNGRRREEYLRELNRLEDDERMGHMFDVPRLRAALEQWPEQTETDPQKFFAAQFGVPAALLTARFVNYVEGRNAV
jgi:asparagine synthase (glutamine-hydrolysing)